MARSSLRGRGVSAALVALQTRVRFRRNPDGTWSLDIEKKAASDGLLKSVADLARKLLLPKP